MKTKNTVLTLVAIVMSVFAFAANPSKMAVINQPNSETIKVYYEGATAGKVTLKIYDNLSNEVFAETIKGLSKFMRPLNFSGMQSGVYTIEITDENGTQIQKVNYETASADGIAESTSIKALHVSKLQDGKYLVCVANEGTEQINIRIFDNDNNLVYNENRTVNGGLGVVYNLKEVSGQPVFMITDGTGKNHTIK